MMLTTNEFVLGTTTLAVLALALVMVGYAVYRYQTAYGVMIGPNGTMNVPGMPGTTIRAPPGSNVNNLTLTRYGPNGTAITANLLNQSNSGQESNSSSSQFNPSFMNLTNGTYTLYNETSGSTSLMRFNHDGTYDRILHGNDWRGIWDATIILEKILQMCPTYEPGTSSSPVGCNLIEMKLDTPSSLGYLDSYGNTMHLIRNGYSVPPPTTSEAALLRETTPDAFTDLTNGTYTLYNESNGSVALLQFGPDGRYNKVVTDSDGNTENLTGIWNTNTVKTETLQICPTFPKLMKGCMIIGLKPDPSTSDQVGFMDDHGDTMYLRHDGNDGGEIDR
jgi:hypothetical protein